MDTELLRTFLEIRSTRHFGRAADNLCITQAAVSARIKQLEELLGVSLFIRTRNNIQLSAQGERLLPHAEVMLTALAHARREIQLDADDQPLVLGLDARLWGGAVPDKIETLLVALPDLKLDVITEEEIQRRLQGKTLNAAIIRDPSVKDSSGVAGLESLAIGELTLRLFSHTDMASMAKAVTNNSICLDWGNAFAQFYRHHFDSPVPRLRTNCLSVAIDYIASQGGACYLPLSMKPVLAERNLVPVRGAPVFTCQLRMLFHSSASRPGMLEELVRQLSGIKL